MIPAMETGTLILFAATVLPLICTPGPDMLFVVAQTMAGSTLTGIRATAGICVGYAMHSALVALGLAAIIAASPLLFEGLRWIGVAYLVYLACQLMRSALRRGQFALAGPTSRAVFRRGFLTAFLNPKGMMIYFAILPQFMAHDGNAAMQATLLSAIFIALCGIVYVGLSVAIGALGRRRRFSDLRRRWVEGVAGGLLLLAAGRLATN